jgi:hypothetical protein
MSGEMNQQIQVIRAKVARLLADKQALEKQVKTLLQELETLNARLQKEKILTRTLEEQNKIVNIAVALQDKSADKAEIALVINRYIRDIEECIRLIGEKH